MPDTTPTPLGNVKSNSHDDQTLSQALNNPDEQTAKRPRLDTDGHGPTLSSSYRPRQRPDPITQISTSSPTISSSTSSHFQSEHIVTPSSSSSTNFQQNQNHNHYRPSVPAPLSSLSSTPVLLSSSHSDVKSSLPLPTPPVHALPPRPQVSLAPTNPWRMEPDTGSAITATAQRLASITSPEDTAAKEKPADVVKTVTESASNPLAPDPPSADEIRRRADEVIARLMGTAAAPSPTTPAPIPVPAPSTSEEGSLERKAEDVIARLERETRARESAVPPGMFRPPHIAYGLPARPPVGFYPPGGMVRPPQPPQGWRPPVGYGPPPGWRPPGPIITRFPRPPSALSPPPSVTQHLSRTIRPPVLPKAPSPAMSAPIAPSPETPSTPLVQASEQTRAEDDMPILLPKKRKSQSTDPSVQPKPRNQVYIGNLPANTQLATLRKAFEALSPILTIELRAPYAMIEFEEDGMAQQAVEVYDEGSFGGVQIRVERASD